VGVRYEAFPRFILAASFQNLGDIQILNQESAIPTLGRLGFAWKCLSTPLHTLDLAMDGDYDPNTQITRLGWGAEYWYQNLFALRAGYVGNSEEEGPSFGAGIRYMGFQLDYGYEPLSVLGSTQRISLMAYLGSGKGSEVPPPAHLQSNPTNDGLMLSWDAPSFVDIQGYKVYVKRPGTETLACVTAHPLSETSVDLKHLKIGEDYEFAVSTLNRTGQESPLNRIEVVAQEPVPSSPTGFKAWKKGDDVLLTWDKVDPAYVSGFNLYMVDETGSPERKLSSKPLTDNHISLKKLKHDQTYWFVLMVLSKDGQEGPPTNVLAVRFDDLPKQ
jgi:hypothetical protein